MKRADEVAEVSNRPPAEFSSHIYIYNICMHTHTHPSERRERESERCEGGGGEQRVIEWEKEGDGRRSV